MKSSAEQQKYLIQEYKNNPKKIGAYSIINTLNRKCFIGVSRDIDARLNRHRFALKTNTEHLCGELQADWNQFGPENFEFRILDIIDPPNQADYDPADDLQVLEQLWFDQINPFIPNGYNKR